MVKSFGFFTAYMIILSGCASVDTQLPIPDISLLSAETDIQEKRAFDRYITMLDRLDRVSSKVLQSNAELCSKKTLDLGVITHSKKTYPKHLRDAASRHVGALDQPSVLMVRADSPAAASGVVTGDVLVDEKNKPISGSKLGVMFMADPAAHASIQSEGEQQPLQFEAPETCKYPVRLKFSQAVNAYANGKAIIVTTGMMDFAARDEELALVVGHELAHNTMRHVPKSIRNFILSGFATRTTRPFESEADYVGLYYMARAGYEMKDVEDFWRRLGIKNPKSIVRAKTHPMTPDRLLSIRMTQEEIEQKRLDGEPLVPNYLPGKEPNLEN